MAKDNARRLGYVLLAVAVVIGATYALTTRARKIPPPQENIIKVYSGRSWGDQLVRLRTETGIILAIAALGHFMLRIRL